MDKLKRYVVEPQSTICYIRDTTDNSIVCQAFDATNAVKVARALNFIEAEFQKVGSHEA